MADNYVVIQNYLEQLKKNLHPEALQTAEQYISDLGLQKLTDEEKILKIDTQLVLLQQEINKLECPEFSYMVNYDHVIQHLLYSRLLFFDKNESQLIKDAMFLNYKHMELQKQYQKLKKKFSNFTFNDFLTGKPNIIFYKLNQCPGQTTELEYHQMRSWQSNKLLELVQLETSYFIEIFTRKSRKQNHATEIIDQEISRLQDLFKNSWASPDELKSKIMNLAGLQNSTFPHELTGFATCFTKFLHKTPDLSMLTPQNLQNSISSYLSSKLKKPVSLMPVLCYSLIKYAEWLTKIKAGELTVNEKYGLLYDNLFEETYSNALEKSKVQIEELKAGIAFCSSNVETYQRYILTKLNSCRTSLKELGDDNYFNLAPFKNYLRSKFILKCLFHSNPGIQVNQLKQAIILNEKINFLTGELEISKEELLNFTSRLQPELQYQLIKLILFMVPSSFVIKKILNLLSNTLTYLKRGRKPILFILMDLNDELSEIFMIVDKQLKDLIDCNESHKILEFSYTMIKELKRKMLEFNELKISCHEKTDYLEKLFRLETNCRSLIANEKKIDFTTLLNPADEKPKCFSFEMRPEFEIKLRNVLTALCLHVQLLDHRTSVDDLMDVLKARDLTLINKKIHIGCETTQFRYIIDKMIYMFDNLSCTNIGKYGLFMTRYDKQLRAGNLWRSNKQDPKLKDMIDWCFKLHC